MVRLTIDGKVVEAKREHLFYMPAESVGIKIPTLCYIKDLLPDGSCRMCMVEIENRGRTKMETACTAQVAEGLVVTTNSEKVRNARRNVLDMLYQIIKLIASLVEQMETVNFKIYVMNMA